MSDFLPKDKLATVTGEVIYKERKALHPLCTITVQLLDTSRADARAVLLGEQSYQTGGKQVPLPFEIQYDETQVDPRGTYTVSARILGPDGRLNYISDTSTPVITRNNPVDDIVILVTSVAR
jgi:putative lipoprotein